jgi:hypothetical protein
VPAALFASSRDVIIQTLDWEAATAFYETVLRLPVTHRSDRLMGFETGSFRLYVERGVRPGPVFDFLVTDVAATKRTLLASGCVVVDEDPAVPRCYLQDPYGLVFNLGTRASNE